MDPVPTRIGASRTALGRLFVAAGALLLVLYLVPTLSGRALAHLAILRFRHQSAANSLWDSARIRAYQASLRLTLPPPEAILRIPRAGIEVPLLEGTSALVMNRGVGHVAGTALPGQTGNLAIAGHRDGFFRGLKDVAPGDLIELDRPAPPAGSPHIGQLTDRYVVRSIRIVLPSDTSVLQPTSSSTLTLITCFPFHYLGAAPQRYIVQADLLPSSQAAPQTVSQAASQTVSQAASSQTPHLIHTPLGD